MADVTSPFGFPYPEPTDLVRDGATDIEALAEGVNDQFLAGFQFAGQRIYTSSGTFEKADPLGTGDIGLRAIRVTVVGGGGGGGGCAATTSNTVSASDGGGGGGFASTFVVAASLPTSVTVSRGAGGAGGNSSPSNGLAGGSSSFDGFAVATGGGGGSRGTQLSPPAPNQKLQGQPGLGTAGDILAQGGSGGYGFGAPNRAQGGDGGSSVFCGRTTGRHFDNSAGLGSTPNGFGGGAGGSSARFNNAGQSGAAGANGIVVVEVFV